MRTATIPSHLIPLDPVSFCKVVTSDGRNGASVTPVGDWLPKAMKFSYKEAEFLYAYRGMLNPDLLTHIVGATPNNKSPEDFLGELRRDWKGRIMCGWADGIYTDEEERPSIQASSVHPLRRLCGNIQYTRTEMHSTVI